MLSLNRTERRSLATATGLVVLGTALRLLLGPHPGDVDWQPVTDPGLKRLSIATLRESVQAGVAREERAHEPLMPGETLDPNFADVTELRRLPGIGPTKAEAILRDRRERGPFRSLEELTRVAGIGPKTVERLAPHLSLESSRRPLQPGGPLNRALDLNRASAETLQELPGIGPELARRIVEFRRSRGSLRTPDELNEVPGIGPATVEKIRRYVRIR